MDEDEEEEFRGKEDPPLLSHELTFVTEFQIEEDEEELKQQNAQSTFVNLFEQRNARKRKGVDIFTA